MTTDITELAQSLKAAAEKATPGEWVYFPKNTSIEYGVGSDESQGSILYVDSGDFTQAQTDRNGEFIALANPANILALVEALEKAQSAKPCEHSMFWDASGVKRCSKCDLPEHANVHYADAAEMEIAALRQRIAELEFIRTSADKVQREFADELGCAGDNESILQAIEDLKVQSETALELKRAALADNAHLKLELEILESRTVTDWIEHDGKWRPDSLSTDELIYMKTRKQELKIPYPAGKVKGWMHTGGDMDIMAYKLVSPQARTVTVKLPPKIERDDADDWFMYKGGRVGGGAAEWYNKALDDVGAELTAAGIKWEAA